MQVFYSSPWIPPEWIRAHGLEPRGLWCAEGLGGGTLPVPAGVCAFSESVVRFTERFVRLPNRPAAPGPGRRTTTEAGLGGHPADSAVIFTTTCDQMRRGFDDLSEALSPRAFLFNVPATWQSPAAQRLFLSEVERLGCFLVKLGGVAPAADRLEQAMAQFGEARNRLLAAVPGSSARGLAEGIARFHWDGSVNLPLPPALPAPEAVPLALVGGPLLPAQWPLLEAIEGAGGRVVLNATETGERSLLPAFPASCLAKASAAGLARFCLEHRVDVFQRPNTRLYAWLGERLAARHVRGLLLWHYVNCDLWRAEAQSLREAFTLPLLQLDADDPQARSPRSLGRIQAFLEMLR